MRGRKARTFRFRKTSFVHSETGTYYALLLGYFGMKFLPDIHHCVYWVLDDTWAPHSFQNIFNNSWPPRLKGRFVFVWNCLIFFLGEYSSIWPQIFRVLFQIQLRLFTWNFRKKLFRENFSEILYKPRLSPLPKLVKFHHSFCNFILVRIALKKFTQLLLYIVCTQVRRQVHKQTTKRRYGEEKLGHFVFEKPVLFTLRLGPTTPYSLGILVWNFYQTFIIVSIEFWLTWAPHSFHRIFNKFFIHHCQDWKEGSFMCETVLFFPRWILIHLTSNLSHLVPN